MTTATLEKKLKPLGEPVGGEFLRWLYLHLPPRPLTSRKMHRGYAEAVQILLAEAADPDSPHVKEIAEYLAAVAPFIEEFEKKEYSTGPATPEEVFRYLLEQNDLSQYAVAKELGGQPVVSAVLSGKRRLTREHIERLSKRFGVPPAAFYPVG